MITLEESNRRLLMLASFLETLPADRFDYSVYVGHNWKGALDLSCGTSACALGWAAAMPEFNKLGLRWRVVSAADRTVGAIGNIVYGDSQSFETDPTVAACGVFGLSYEEASFLFEPDQELTLPDDTAYVSPGSDAGAVEVAEHIKHFIKIRAVKEAV